MTSQRDRGSPSAQAGGFRQDGPDQSGTASALGFPVVAVGASAGGLDAFKTLLEVMPADTGMAFVLVQHLAPTHVSLMSGLLAGHTRMPVAQAVDGVSIERDRVYLIPPAVSLAIAGGKLHLSEPKETHGTRKAFDFFLRSLAEAQGERSACIVLSGAGTDGSEGVNAVKDKGGLVIVQDPSEAAFDGMPKSAIHTGKADHVLPIAEIPGVLIRHFEDRFFGRLKQKASGTAGTDGPLLEIVELVRDKKGQDFSLYKPGTLMRRIGRRMSMAGIAEIEGYVARLRSDAAEIDRLAQDLLINVTQFFRDPDVFTVLAETVIPALVAEQPLDQPLRIWTPGCSTGEEVYSLAILFLEAIAALRPDLKLQVFASDVDADSVALARAGLYGRETEAQISPERLRRFFTREEDQFCVSRKLRETVIFAVQDLLADPPFSRLDFISCRNVLIYLRPDAQQQVLSLFHFGLRAGGVLLLGRSETLGPFADYFEAINKKQRIYRHLADSRPGEVEFASRRLRERRGLAIVPPARKPGSRLNLDTLSLALLRDSFAPPSVLIDEKFEAVFYSGDVDRFLQLAPGEAHPNILVMARPGLRPKIKAALNSARETKEPSWKDGAKITRDGASIGVRIFVRPILGEGLYLVSFVEETAPEPLRLDPQQAPEDPSRVLQLEQELDETRLELSATIRDLEMSNEELRIANEEALSTNEEFQSTNEELETSKEELQSLNEELTALNAQLHETLEQQRATAADLQNILNCSDVATLFLDEDLNIRFYTPAARLLFAIRSGDIGRPLLDLAPRFSDDALIADARSVLSGTESLRREIRGHNGRWYLRSILPYRVNPNRIEGVVITFADISDVKAAERKIASAEGIIGAVKQPLVVLDAEFRVVSASPAFYRVFGFTPEDSVGQPLTLGGHLKPETLTSALASPDKNAAPVEDRLLKIALPGRGRRTFRLDVREILDDASFGRRLLVTLDDVTDAEARSAAISRATGNAERANLTKSSFLAAASHDLRQPLQKLSLLQGMMAETAAGPEATELANRLKDTIAEMSIQLDKLVDLNQLEAGVVSPLSVDFAINTLLAKLQAEFDIRARNEGLELRVVPCHLTVHTDPRLLEPILRNLVSNAVKYTGRGKILIGCRRHGPRLRIEIWDTGGGLPADKLGAIAKEGRQPDTQMARQPKGYRLGLSIAQQLAHILRARIAVRSQLGRGAMFAVEVPLADRPPGSFAAAGGAALSSTQRSTILIVENDMAVRDTLKLLLETRGFQTLAARDGAQALSIAFDPATSIDLVIADYSLPGPNGLEVLASLEKAQGRRTPAIILTGDISSNTLREIAAQSYVHLYSPVDAGILFRNIDSALGSARRSPDAVRILIVDDDAESREAIGEMLAAHGFRTEIFADTAALLAAVPLGRVDCVIAAPSMPGIDGLELIDGLAKIHPAIPVIIVTDEADIEAAVRAMKAGAFDFLEKPVRRKDLIERVTYALRHTGEKQREPADWQAALGKMDHLTDRQRQILARILTGAPSKTIAADLKISQRTVDNHRAAIMRKLGANSLPALIRIAVAAAKSE